MVVQWKKYFFVLNEFYGEEKLQEGLPKADLHAYFQQKKLKDSNKWFTIHKQTLTLCFDLHKSEEELRKDMNRTTRYQINKAARDELSLEYLTEPTNEDIEEFEKFFNPFAKEKNIEVCRTDKLKSFAAFKRLVISSVYHKDGRRLASHAYILTEQRAVMLYSCSSRFTNNDIPGLNIGRANRYLHWNDILFFKEWNFKYYDFLGLSIDKEDKAQQNVNRFKKGFGGEEIVEFQSFIPQNFRGKLLILALKVLWRKQLELIRGETMPVMTYLSTMEE